MNIHKIMISIIVLASVATCTSQNQYMRRPPKNQLRLVMRADGAPCPIGAL